MKEHVVKKNDNRELPKNIRQVGDLDLDKRVYIEDYAFSFVKETSLDDEEEGRVGILLGRISKVRNIHSCMLRWRFPVLLSTKGM